MTICTFSPHLVTTKIIGFNPAEVLRFRLKPPLTSFCPKVNTVLRKVYISKIGEDGSESKVWKHDNISYHEASNLLQFQ